MTFFSGTDWENLEDRSLVSNYFLMLIVNFAGDYIAKVAFKAKKEGGKKTKLAFVNNMDGLKAITLKSDGTDEVLVVMNCKVEVDDVVEIDGEFTKRYEEVVNCIKEEQKQKEGARKKAMSVKRYDGGRPYTGKQVGLWDEGWTPVEDDMFNGRGSWRDDWEYERGGWKKKEKKISEMTEKEYREWEQETVAEEVFLKDQDGQVGEEFDLRHARAFLNSILSGTYMMDNFMDCMERVGGLDRKMTNARVREEWVDEFQDDLQEHFDVIFPKATIEQYGELLNKVGEYLQPYKMGLVEGMLEAIRDEIEMSYNPKIMI